MSTVKLPSGSLILLTGATGQVGGALLPLLQTLGQVIAPKRAELDLSNPVAVRDFVRRVAPRWIVNPAAYTAVDRAEGEPGLADFINHRTPQALAVEASRLGCPLLHFSTDYVFDGTGTTPWKESDPTGPLSVYGKTKLAGEQAITSSGAAHIILRTSWVYASQGKNFPLTILRLAREREEMRIVADQHGAPTSAVDLARVTMHVMKWTEQEAARQGSTPVQVLELKRGIYHAAGAGETTWFGFAQALLAHASEAEPDRRFARLVPIATAEYPTPAHRPANSRLDCSRLYQDFGFAMPRWEESAYAAFAK